MIELFFDTLKEAIGITLIVSIMMLIIEYINVLTRGKLAHNIGKSKWRQVITASLLGLIPGCLGVFSIVSLYTHGMLSFGAIVAGMITTFGDEAFVLFSYSPQWTLILAGALVVVAIPVGLLCDMLTRNRILFAQHTNHIVLHEDDLHHQHTPKLSLRNLTNISFQRAILLAGLCFYIIGTLSGILGCEHGEHECHHHLHTGAGLSGESILFLLIAGITLFIIATVEEHFLDEHLWKHVIKKHFLSIFGWTFGALLLIAVLSSFIDLNTWIRSHEYAKLLILVIAVLMGIIPESGPHLIIVVLFFQGSIPFSILLANSISQDGHGGLPLLADSRRKFFLIKGINALVGLIVGLMGYFMGW